MTAASDRKRAVAITALYVGVGVLWVLLSDQLLVVLFPGSPTRMALAWETVKGLAFVGITGAVLFFLVGSFLRSVRRSEAALRESETRMRQALDHIPTTFSIYDKDLRLRYVNARGVRLSGYELKDMIGRRDEELFPAESTAEYLPLLRKAAETGQTQSAECVVQVPNGPRLVAAISFVPVLDEKGEIRQILSITHNITERKQMEEALRESEEKWRQLAETLPGAVYVCMNDEKYTMMFLSAAVENLTGYPREEFLSGKLSFVDLFHPDDLAGIYRETNQAVIEHRPFRLTYRLRHRNGDWRWVGESGVGIYEGNQLKLLQGILIDATSQKRTEEQLLFNALHDPLTGLANRTLLIDHLEQAVHRRRRRDSYCFAVLFVDLDRFKIINDSLGHLAGDEVLKVVAKRLQECLRPGDTVARFAGDEFTLLLDELRHPDDAIQVADRVLRAVSQPMILSGTEAFTSASIGIAISSPAYRSAEELLRDADNALYRAKAGGKARYVLFDASMHARVLARLEMENDLRRALEHGDLQVHYQPILDLRSSRVAGFEALVRWLHPEKGMIPPTAFIPLAEESGLIVQLGDWVLRRAMEQLADWHQRFPSDPPLSMSVNLSPRQFYTPDLARTIAEAAVECGVTPSSLKLEITESLLMENREEATSQLQSLHESGFSLCLDDFGTGYSSLSYLHSFPIDVVKIDRSFVSRLERAGKEREIVRSVIGLAGSLGMEVTAEGVETEDQLALLREMQCPYVQGYFLSRPLAAEAAASFLESRPV